MQPVEAGLNDIAEGIAYLEASENPLSANVGIIRDSGITWIFDVGSNDLAAEIINAAEGEKRVVLSHFHADHTHNLSRIKSVPVYGGDFTCKKFQNITPVTKDMYFDKIHLFPIPSTHAKGCIGLEFGNCAFLGDGTYCTKKNGAPVYNAGLLLETIKVLKGLKAENFLLSHAKPFVRSKERVIGELERIYSYRKKNEPYININEILEKNQ